jgi:hypothetical protein
MAQCGLSWGAEQQLVVTTGSALAAIPPCQLCSPLASATHSGNRLLSRCATRPASASQPVGRCSAEVSGGFVACARGSTPAASPGAEQPAREASCGVWHSRMGQVHPAHSCDLVVASQARCWSCCGYTFVVQRSRSPRLQLFDALLHSRCHSVASHLRR